MNNITKELQEWREWRDYYKKEEMHKDAMQWFKGLDAIEQDKIIFLFKKGSMFLDDIESKTKEEVAELRLIILDTVIIIAYESYKFREQMFNHKEAPEQ